jgi:hypothetical protein
MMWGFIWHLLISFCHEGWSRRIGDQCLFHRHLGAPYGPILGPVWVPWGPAFWVGLGPIWDHSGPVLGPFWARSGPILGPFWAHVWAHVWAHDVPMFGPLMGPFGVHILAHMDTWAHYGPNAGGTNIDRDTWRLLNT